MKRFCASVMSVMWLLQSVILAAMLCAESKEAFARVDEATSKNYEVSVQMTATKEQQLRDLATTIINSTYNDVLTRWNGVTTGFTGFPQGQNIQFQGSIGYHMALSLPDRAKSDADVAFLYQYKNGGTTQPSSSTVYAAKFKELAKDAFRARYANYTYEVKNPVVAINVPVQGLTDDHVDVAFFDSLQRTNPPSPANCVTGSIQTSPCSELNWGTTPPNSGSAQDQSKWEPNDRLNLTAILNNAFDRNPTPRELTNRAGKIFKEWRFKIYSDMGQDVTEYEKVPSIALVTLMYNVLNGASTSYSNTFDLLAATLARGARDNFNNGNCTTNPAAFAIRSITYPYANLLDRLTTQEKQTFCQRFMEFKASVDAAIPASVSDPNAVRMLQRCFPANPSFGPPMADARPCGQP